MPSGHKAAVRVPRHVGAQLRMRHQHVDPEGNVAAPDEEAPEEEPELEGSVLAACAALRLLIPDWAKALKEFDRVASTPEEKRWTADRLAQALDLEPPAVYACYAAAPGKDPKPG